jgi:ribosome-associated protein
MVFMAPRKSTLEHLEVAAGAALDKLGKDLVAIDLTEQMVLSEVFLLVSGGNERQIDSIGDEVELRLGALGEKPSRRERSAHWILLDYEDLVVHIQTEEIRRYYMLERLWNDCPRIELSAIREDEAKRGGQK